MTNVEVKKIMKESGLSSEDIKNFQNKFDAEKITEVVNNASCASEAFKAINELYPDLKVEELKKQSDFMMGQIAAAVEEAKKKGPVELSTEELENVAGGGFFSDVGNWFKNNWKTILVGAAVVVAVAAASALTAGAFCAVVGGVCISMSGAGTFLAGAAFGASVGLGAGACFGALMGVVADCAGAAQGLVDQYWS